MAFLALRHIFVLCMVTECAIDLSMLALRLLPFAVNSRVACAASCRRSIICIDYLQRLVDRMTLCAGCYFLAFKMRFMAIETRWDQPMSRMAAVTSGLEIGR